MIAVINIDSDCAKQTAQALSTLTNNYLISDNEDEICSADKLILVGGGIAAEAIKRLHLLNLFTVLRVIKKPFLGIGLGLHLMCQTSKEGGVSCLGIFPGEADLFEKHKKSSGHNEGFSPIKILKESPLFNNIKDGEKFYFEHSLFLPKNDFTTSSSQHGIEFSASAEKDICYAVQFHPEKSGDAGLQLLQNFINL